MVDKKTLTVESSLHLQCSLEVVVPWSLVEAEPEVQQ